ncbi:MBL fold metallo-hydrolase [Jatrophihabitans sp. DSM 45814]
MTRPNIDVLIAGYPGISESNGGLSWSTVGIVQLGNRNVLIDTGPVGARGLLRRRLSELHLACEDITDVVLTHLHHDHSINWPMFTAARIHVSRRELQWTLDLPPGIEPTPEFYAAALAARADTALLDDTDEIVPGIRTELVPGHTPGSIIVRIDTGEGEVIFLGDAAKYRAELMSLRVAATSDSDASRQSLELILQRWQEDPRTIVMPGHDLPLRFRNGECETVGTRHNSLQARLGTDFDDVTNFPLG